jgi:hypothetical protein
MLDKFETEVFQQMGMSRVIHPIKLKLEALKLRTRMLPTILVACSVLLPGVMRKKKEKMLTFEDHNKVSI